MSVTERGINITGMRSADYEWQVVYPTQVVSDVQLDHGVGTVAVKVLGSTLAFRHLLPAQHYVETLLRWWPGLAYELRKSQSGYALPLAALLAAGAPDGTSEVRTGGRAGIGQHRTRADRCHPPARAQ